MVRGQLVTRRLTVLLGLAVAVIISGCEGTKAPDRWEAADQATREGAPVSEAGTSANSQALPADKSGVLEGSEFNKFFPEVTSPWDIVFKQEKPGFAQASLQRDGTETAVLSISDTRNNAAAADKYKAATDKVDGYPYMPSGSLGSGILVANRFQVQVRSAPDKGLSESERKEWLKKVDLIGLEALR